MLSRPRIKRCFTAIVIEPALLFLMSEHTELVFQGEAYVALTPLLDGRRSLSEVLSGAAPHADLASLFGALANLERKGALVEGESLPDDGTAAFWECLGAEADRVRETLAQSSIAVQALAGLSLTPLHQTLTAAGLRVAEDGALRLVVVGDYLSPELAAVNETALADGRSWALVKPVGSVVWVGPIFQPGETGCWECLAQRLRMKRQVERYLARHTGRPAPLQPAKGWLASSIRLAASWVASELARSLVLDGPETLRGQILTLDLVRRELARHSLVKRPQCPACGQKDRPATAASTPVVLESRLRPPAVGLERTSSAEETYEAYKHHVSAITGVVTYLGPRDPIEHGPTHNYLAAHYFPLTSESLTALRLNLVAGSGGKGRTEAQARTSALCEALERYSGIVSGDEPRIMGTYAALRPEGIHIRDLALFSERQYATRETSAPASDRHAVPEPLPDDAEISWSPAWSLTQKRVRYLPTGYCYYGHRDPRLLFTACDSNGSAAGNTLEEAILYGFLELVERDSVALWWYNRLRRPALEADGFGLSYWYEMKRHYERDLRRELHALDLTADLGIPTFAVISRRRDRAPEDVIIGLAAHLDPTVALLRALEEANQYLPSVRDEAEDGSTLYRLLSEETVRWWKSATFDNQPYLVPDPQAPPRRLGDLPRLASDDVRTDVETCLRAAERCGLEVLVLDQSRPDIGLPVVKVVIPGMRHFWRRLAPGRLYDVPVRLGWLSSPLSEDDLNPVSCFV
jgi:ribosomal protein S12 methylthiotransferase accessory factor